MSDTATLAQRVCEQARALPEDSLLELARDYDELADHYNELAAELADEVWLPLENESLLRMERDIGS